MVGYSDPCNGTGDLTIRGIYLTNLMDVYSQNDSAPCSQLNSWLALSSGVFIPLQEPISPTHQTTLTLPTRIQT